MSALASEQASRVTASDEKGGNCNISIQNREEQKLYGNVELPFTRQNLSLKSKGLLSQMLSLPENWGYTLRGRMSASEYTIYEKRITQLQAAQRKRKQWEMSRFRAI